MVFTSNIFENIYTVFTAFMLACSLWFLGKMVNMVIYQARYGGNAGELYLQGRKEEIKK